MIANRGLVALNPGDVFEDLDTGRMFEVAEHLGTGGFGSTYFVTDSSSGDRLVAKLPVITGDKQNDEYRIRKTEHEGEVLKTLLDNGVPHVVPFRGQFETEIAGHRVPVVLMEVARGTTLDDYIFKELQAPMKEDEARELLLQLCTALQGVHSLGIVHRDIKPDNIFIDTQQPERDLTLIDFGIAALYDNSKTYDKVTAVGTPFFSAPEGMYQGFVSFSADVFSVGAVGFFLLTAQQPAGLRGGYDPRLYERKGFPVSDDIAQVIVKATWEDFKLRYPTIEDLMNAIRGRPPLHLMPRIIVDGTSYAIDKDLIIIGSARVGSSVDIAITERTQDGKYYISRKHCYIKLCDDGLYRLYDGSPEGRPSTNGTVWLDKRGNWRRIPREGLVLGNSPYMIGLGYSEPRTGTGRDMFGHERIPRVYRTIEYRPPGT